MSPVRRRSNIMKNKLLSVSAIWVTRNQHDALPESCSQTELLEGLHSALHLVHAGLWVCTKPHSPRFVMRKLEIDGETVEIFQVCFNGMANEESVLGVVRGHGFIKYSGSIQDQAQYPKYVSGMV